MRKEKIKKIICEIIFMFSSLIILFTTNYEVQSLNFWLLILGILGVYNVGVYEGENGIS